MEPTRKVVQVEVQGAPISKDNFLIGHYEYCRFVDPHTIHATTRRTGPITITLITSPDPNIHVPYLLLNLSECYDIHEIVDRITQARAMHKSRRVVIVVNSHNNIYALATGMYNACDIRTTSLNTVLDSLLDDTLVPLRSNSTMVNRTVIITLYKGDAPPGLMVMVRSILQLQYNIKIEMRQPCSLATATLLSGDDRGDRDNAYSFIERIIMHQSLILLVSRS